MTTTIGAEEERNNLFYFTKAAFSFSKMPLYFTKVAFYFPKTPLYFLKAAFHFRLVYTKLNFGIYQTNGRYIPN
jgi:hypothetical protein